MSPTGKKLLSVGFLVAAAGLFAAALLSGCRDHQPPPAVSPPPAAASATAQFVEVNAEFEATLHRSNSTTGQVYESHRVYHVQCIVGTNRWMIEGNFALNAQETYWCTGTNIMLYTVVTSSSSERLQLMVQNQKAMAAMHPELPPRPVPTPVEPKVGYRFTVIIPSTDPNQLALGYDKVPWLAFCSGPFLHSDGRRVPLPIGVNPRASYSQNYSDTTSVFPDALGLPKRMELRTPDNHLLCEYTVQETTNVLGWSFPMRFKIVQYEPDRSGIWQDCLHTEGKVISIRKAKAPDVPDDVLQAIKQR